MTDDGYRGYDINEEGDVMEFYDHRDEFKPTPGTGRGNYFALSEVLIQDYQGGPTVSYCSCLNL